MRNAVSVQCLRVCICIWLWTNLFTHSSWVVSKGSMWSIVGGTFLNACARFVIWVIPNRTVGNTELCGLISIETTRNRTCSHTHVGGIIRPLGATQERIFYTLSWWLESPGACNTNLDTNPGGILCIVINSSYNGTLCKARSLTSLITIQQWGTFSNTQVSGVVSKQFRHWGTNSETEINSCRDIAIIMFCACCYGLGTLTDTIVSGWVSEVIACIWVCIGCSGAG